MTAPGTIIGQIQPTQTAQGTMQQVGGSPAQIQQLQQGAQQAVTISNAQQVHLSATVQSVKDDISTVTGAGDAISHNSSVAGKPRRRMV